MFKLLMLSGPEPNKEFQLEDGNYMIGRSSECNIHINSDIISKRHAILMVSQGKVTIEDLESRNGTFVNGVMIRRKDIKAGDRISFKDIILELRLTKRAPTPHFEKPAPKVRVQNKQSWYDPILNSVVQHVEWKYLALLIFFGFIAVNFSVSIPPLLDETKTKLQTEALKRAEFIAKQLAQTNQKNLNLKNGILVSDNLNLNVDSAYQEERILSVNIINPQTKRVIAPSERLDLPLDNRGPFLRGSEAKKLMIEKINEREVLISQPIYLYSSQEDKDVVGAIVQAVFNIDGIGLTSNETTQLLLKSLIISLLIGVAFYFVFQQLTSSAFRKIYSEIESASQKGFKHVELKTKFEDIQQVVHSINKVFKKTRDLITKLPKESLTEEDKASENTDEVLKNLLSAITEGVAVIDPAYHILHMNPVFQKITRIREGDEQKNVLDLIQDQELLKNISHGLGQASVELKASEQIDVQDKSYDLMVTASKNPSQEIEFYIVRLKEQA